MSRCRRYWRAYRSYSGDMTTFNLIHASNPSQPSPIIELIMDDDIRAQTIVVLTSGTILTGSRTTSFLSELADINPVAEHLKAAAVHICDPVRVHLEVFVDDMQRGGPI